MAEADPPCVIHDLGGAVCVELVHPIIVDDTAVAAFEEVARQALQDYPDKRLLVDFTNVTYVSSAMFSCLILLNREMKQRGLRLLLCGMSALIREVFAVTHLDQLFDFCESREAVRQRAN